LQIKDLQEGHEYSVRIMARNEVGLSDPLESEEPIKVIRPPGKTHSNNFLRFIFVKCSNPIFILIVVMLFKTYNFRLYFKFKSHSQIEIIDKK
jgi:hypothetical protein